MRGDGLTRARERIVELLKREMKMYDEYRYMLLKEIYEHNGKHIE